MEFNFLQSLPAIAPEIGLTVMAVVVLLLDAYLPESQRRNIAFIAGFGLLATAAAYFLLWAPTPETQGLYWGGNIRHDTLAEIFKIMVLIAAAITCFMGVDAKSLARRGEFYLIIIVSSLGASLMAAATDLILVILALETTTIPLYVLAAFRRDDKRSSEAGMKYFLFGSFASAILLYGLSLLYGFTGHTNLYDIAAFLGTDAFSTNAVPVLISIALIVTGFGFKISAVPFHFWTPDVYEGAPTPVTAFLSVASKAASFALLVRFFLAVFPAGLVIDGQQISGFWTQTVSVLALISMTVGNLVALSQKNIKRLLAYSSIAQAGYVLMGVAALSAETDKSIAAIAFYMFMYTFTNLLAFGTVLYFSEATGSENIRDLAGLSRRNPMLALALTIALLSLAGIPPAAGFFGKFFLFQAAVEANLVWLALAGVINAIVALYYYLVVIKVMYVDHGDYEEMEIPVSRSGGAVLAVAALAVILLGTILTTPIFDWAARGAAGLFT
ncbi:MAG: NADH-quinone oxidoreductase subunit N [Chloroflexi bacterium]|nr:NADH-quinone oxidoreductase subunit N [Chloroflexota bacterium]